MNERQQNEIRLADWIAKGGREAEAWRLLHERLNGGMNDESI